MDKKRGMRRNEGTGKRFQVNPKQMTSTLLIIYYYFHFIHIVQLKPRPYFFYHASFNFGQFLILRVILTVENEMLMTSMIKHRRLPCISLLHFPYGACHRRAIGTRLYVRSLCQVYIINETQTAIKKKFPRS